MRGGEERAALHRFHGGSGDGKQSREGRGGGGRSDCLRARDIVLAMLTEIGYFRAENRGRISLFFFFFPRLFFPPRDVPLIHYNVIVIIFTK